MNDIYRQLEDFVYIDGHRFPYNKWIADEVMKVYLRRGKHYINDHKYTTLDIASVEVVEWKRRQGYFSRFLQTAVEIKPWEGVYVENVITPFLALFLSKNGFKYYQHSYYVLF